MKRLIVIAAAFAATTTTFTAQDQVQRRSPAGAPDAAGRPAPVQVPRHPYAGAWEGKVALTDAAGAESPSALVMSFAVKDGARQAYSGETRLGTQPAMAHTNISAAPDASAAKSDAGTGPAMRRSAPASTTASGPSASTPEIDTIAAGTHAMLVHHTPTKSLLLCDQGGRCVTLTTLTWEERDRGGRRYSYSAKLTGANTLAGSVTVTDASGNVQSRGKFELSRKN